MVRHLVITALSCSRLPPDSLLSPSSHTRTLDEKRLAAAKSATELDAGDKMRYLTLRAQRAVAVGSATSR